MAKEQRRKGTKEKKRLMEHGFDGLTRIYKNKTHRRKVAEMRKRGGFKVFLRTKKHKSP